MFLPKKPFGLKKTPEIASASRWVTGFENFKIVMANLVAGAQRRADQVQVLIDVAIESLHRNLG